MKASKHPEIRRAKLVAGKVEKKFRKQKFKCLYPDCRQPAILSHSQQKEGQLRAIAQNGLVYALERNLFQSIKHCLEGQGNLLPLEGEQEKGVVKTTFNRLKEQGNLLAIGGQQNDRVATTIATFLAWPERRVRDAYINLRSAGEIEPVSSKDTREITPIKKEIFATLPTQKHASEFRRAVKATRASPKVQKTYVSRGGRVETSIPS